jgi:DNA polymerase III delta prime subunit
LQGSASPRCVAADNVTPARQTKMSYDFSNLSPADFEDLVRDLIGREMGVRFEAFGAGPDGGADGRHSLGGRSTILQAKHYLRSTFSSLKAAMKRERTSIDALAPKRYVLATSRPLSPINKRILASIIGPALKDEADLFSVGDLNGLLRKYPDIVKAHIKLWLSGTAVLERVIRSAAYSYTAMSRAEVQAKVRVYAQNRSFQESRDKLEANHVVIISGPPGVGKTTLAEMLAYAYIGEEWEFVAIRSLEDGFAAIVDAKKQIFFFDDFLGKVALDARALSMKDSELGKFIRRVRTTSNARFILTTRAYIFEEARRVSEHLADQRLDITKYVLDVGIYTRRIKARILYNHLFVAGTPKDHIRALWDSGAIANIVDHRNYNPRIIEAMTDSMHVRDVSPTQYPSAFLNGLENPRQIWDTAFRTHIPAMCRNLLFALFFCSEYGVEIDELKLAFNALHSSLCVKYGVPYGPKDFEEALKILEGGFVAINGSNVKFINPSVRDYLADYLDGVGLLCDFARTATKTIWASSLWKHVTSTRLLPPHEQKIVAECFADVAKASVHLPVWKPYQREPGSFHLCDLSNTERISLLLEWFAATGDASFADYALALAKKPVSGFGAWLDGDKLVYLVRDLRKGLHKNYPRAETLAAALESGLVRMIKEGMWADELESLYVAMDSARDELDACVFDAADDAIERQIENAYENAATADSESTLEDQIKAVHSLASRAGVSAERVDIAVSMIQNRISEINERVSTAEPPSFTGQLPSETDTFDDDALRSLFEPLTRE